VGLVKVDDRVDFQALAKRSANVDAFEAEPVEVSRRANHGVGNRRPVESAKLSVVKHSAIVSLFDVLGECRLAASWATGDNYPRVGVQEADQLWS
jgi:hypothetical protein